jgi:phosphatidylinositol kinase/protein kinase (PI-3  family)
VDRRLQHSSKTFAEELTDAQREGRGVSIEHQVRRIIAEATRPENLCQAFGGWCAFW